MAAILEPRNLSVRGGGHSLKLGAPRRLAVSKRAFYTEAMKEVGGIPWRCPSRLFEIMLTN